jgi:hypothetical protein
MRETRPYGSVRGAASDGRPYRDSAKYRSHRAVAANQAASDSIAVKVRPFVVTYGKLRHGWLL